jgi:hypothetical protein
MLDDFEGPDIAHIALFISSERLAKFHEIAGSERDAIALHQHVLAVGAALAPILAMLEIAIRNTICEHLRTMFGAADWLQNPQLPFKWHDEETKLIKNAERHAQRAQYAKLSSPAKRALDAVAYPKGVPKGAKHETRVKARQLSIRVTSGQVVAQLTLYFWKRLFSDNYETSLWKPSLRQIFPNKRLGRTDVSDRLEVIYQARNRVAHHEPIYDDRLEELLRAIDFLCLNFCSRRPSDETPLGKLLRPHRELLAQQIAVLTDALARFRPAPSPPDKQVDA